ncbi:hypothetical protein K737_300111 [Holospora undulata HU1]|uniref:Uncharacterized protein n=2 Tax=Holospora TaxID=44747 RepID=A0A061JH07_9PROT|nr:hypothetical protein K737_300111 [Holospora undulata HU1]
MIRQERMGTLIKAIGALIGKAIIAIGLISGLQIGLNLGLKEKLGKKC